MKLTLMLNDHPVIGFDETTYSGKMLIRLAAGHTMPDNHGKIRPCHGSTVQTGPQHVRRGSRLLLIDAGKTYASYAAVGKFAKAAREQENGDAGLPRRVVDCRTKQGVERCPSWQGIRPAS